MWVSTYTSYLLYKVQDPFSACRQSINQNIVSFFSILREDQSLLHRPRNSGSECAWWTNTLVGQFLHQLSLVQSSRSIQRMILFLFFSILREDQSLLHRPRNSGRECAWWTNSLVGQYLHQLSLLQSSRSIQRMQPKHCFFLLNFEGGPVFASQTKKLRKRMYMVDQLPCGSVLTPAISCTKFKIHSAHADSPLTKTLFLSFQF